MKIKIFFAVLLVITSSLLQAMEQQSNQFPPIDVDTLFEAIRNYADVAKRCIAKAYDTENQSMQIFINNLVKSEAGFDKAWKPPAWRSDFKGAETLIISKTCNKYLSTRDRIVEIGAGRLENESSYLMDRMPKELAVRVEPTDVNNAFIKKSSKLKRVDLCNIYAIYHSSSVDKFIASSVLDTLTDSDLSRASEQIYKVLKPGGLLIHFANLQPFLDTIITSHRRPPHICFPWQDENDFHGLMCIDSENLKKFVLSNKNLSKSEIKFLNWYTGLSASERELTINSVIMESKKNSIDFSNWIKSLNPKGLDFIDNREFFERRTVKALKDTSFEILEAGLHFSSEIRDRNKSDHENFNYFSHQFGKTTNDKIYILPPDKICHVVKMHVLIARKN